LLRLRRWTKREGFQIPSLSINFLDFVKLFIYHEATFPLTSRSKEPQFTSGYASWEAWQPLEVYKEIKFWIGTLPRMRPQSFPLIRFGIQPNGYVKRGLKRNTNGFRACNSGTYKRNLIRGHLWGTKHDGLVKSRHSGENRSPENLYLFERTGFRLSPEWQKDAFSDFLRDHQAWVLAWFMVSWSCQTLPLEHWQCGGCRRILYLGYAEFF